MDSNCNMQMDTLIAQIQDKVSEIVTTHMNEQVKNLAIHIANVYDLDKEEVFGKVVTFLNNSSDDTTVPEIPQLPLNEITPIVHRGKQKVVVTTTELCEKQTKAGAPCKYKRLGGETMCKKHKNMDVAKTCDSNLPHDEKAWFDEKSTYCKSYFPVYQNSQLELDKDIIDDSQDYVTTE